MDINDDLIDRVLQGQATAVEAAEFQKWLNVPANLERFALRAELHADLRRSLRRRDIQNSALEARRDPETSTTTLPSSFHSRQALMLTGVAIAACLIVAFMWPAAEDATDTAGTPVAKVLSNVNGLLTKSDERWDDTNLPTGEYELQKGLFHLQFGGGVMVYLEAPARFDVVSNSRVVLHSGRLSATVPPEGIGFTVETPEAEVVDFGTEFSVDVEGGTSEVHVFDGLVRVHPGKKNQVGSARSVDLQASQAVRITDGMAKPVDISIATNRFIRNFDEPRLNYARAVKRLSPLAYYRMPIRDRGLVAQPPEHSGVVLTGEGKRPPHACGVFVGGSLRVGADSTGRGGRVDSPPKLSTGQFSLTAFVYLEAPTQDAIIATNLDGERGNFGLLLDEDGRLQATIKSQNGDAFVAGESALPLKTWRHLVVTADGTQLQFYQDGNLVASAPCAALQASDSDTVWFGTGPQSTQHWNGRIDEVALFDRALNQEEIAALHRTAQQEIARTK